MDGLTEGILCRNLSVRCVLGAVTTRVPVRLIEEPKPNVQTCCISKVVGVSVKIVVSFWLYYVPSTHRVPVLRCRSMRRWRFSLQ